MTSRLRSDPSNPGCCGERRHERAIDPTLARGSQSLDHPHGFVLHPPGEHGLALLFRRLLQGAPVTAVVGRANR